MNSTARLIAILAGWGGDQKPIKTTQSCLSRHVARSVRQVQRMLDDAWREGYLSYTLTKGARGMITGIKITLNYARIFKQKPRKKPRNPATTFTSDNNRNKYIYNKEKPLLNGNHSHFDPKHFTTTEQELKMDKILLRLGQRIAEKEKDRTH